MTTTFEKRQEETKLRFRYLRGLLLMMEDTVGRDARAAKARDALDTISKLEQEMEELYGRR